MIKKLFLLLLIFPLIVFARPEKKYLQSPLSQMFATLTWKYTVNCNWATTHGTSYQVITDDDCDNNPREKTGIYNTTDITCSDGASNGCDGAYTRIRFSKLLAGTYIILIKTQQSSGDCFYKLTDGTQESVFRGYDNGASVTTANHIMKYDTDQNSEVVWTYEQLDSASACYINNCDVTSNEDCSIIVYFTPKQESPEILYFK